MMIVIYKLYYKDTVIKRLYNPSQMQDFPKSFHWRARLKKDRCVEE